MPTNMDLIGNCVPPPEFHILEREDRRLIIDPVNHVWFATDQTGQLCLQSFAERHSVDDAIQALSSATGISAADPSLQDYLMQLFSHLMDIGFLHASEYATNYPSMEPLEFPQAMYLHLTAACNLKCSYCYNQDHRFDFMKKLKAEQLEGRKDKISRTDQFIALLDEAAAFGLREVKLTGGEATLYKEFLVIARHARSLGLYVNLLSNGGLITDKNAAEIVDAVSVVSISIDSRTADGGHDAIRGEGSHAKALNAIMQLRRAGLRHLHVNGVVTPTTLSSVEEIIAFAENELQAEEVTLAGSAMAVNDPQERFGAAEHMLDAEQYREFEKRQYDFHRAVTKEVPIEFRNQCGVGNGLVSIDPNGDVYPCQTLHEKEFLLGNAFEAGLTAVLNSPERDRTRRATVDKIPECNVCPVRYICSSGCRSEAYSREGDFLARNKEMCPTYFEIAQNKLWDSIPAATN